MVASTRILVAVAVLSFCSLQAGCAASDDELSEDAITSSKVLDRVTVADIAKAYEKARNSDLDACTQAHPAITNLTLQNVDAFTTREDVSYQELAEYIRMRLNGQPSVSVADLRSGARTLAQAELDPLAPAPTFLDYDAAYRVVRNREVLLRYRSAYVSAAEESSFKNAKAPAGTSLRTLRTKWQAVQEERANFDSEFLRPIAFSGAPTVGDLRKAFKIRGDYVASGADAISGFQRASEGAGNAPGFSALANIIKSTNFKKRYFRGGGATDGAPTRSSSSMGTVKNMGS
ncbi:MAG: hypothetical protein U0174_14300 [Polyangiaceae bacterium]